jgi:preprotein translocase subunit SecA
MTPSSAANYSNARRPSPPSPRKQNHEEAVKREEEGAVRQFLQTVIASFDRDRFRIEKINAMRAEFARFNDDQLRAKGAAANDVLEFMAVTATVASRILGQDLYDVQLRGALALTRGSIAEMQTGEGKTLAAVPAIAWFARAGLGVHVITVNDYLARRDAAWMGDIYRFLGLSVAHVQQGMTAAERRAAYRSDITYATANEIGFDFLRDRLALELGDQVQRPFGAAVIDEADSILVDEARVPLVIAGGTDGDGGLAIAANEIARKLRLGEHYTIDAGAHNAALTDAGIHMVEVALRCGNLFEERNLRAHSAVQDALHAHALVHRDVDYLVKNGAIEMVDEFKGRIAQDRRWPAGLHTAIEAKEGVVSKEQGMILGQITLQHLVGLYPTICGMTGTAATQSLELMKVYGLKVETIPPNRPVIRVDHPDIVFPSKAEKEQAVLQEIRRVHDTGQPVLVGTGSVAESERLSSLLPDIPHEVLNARNDEREAAIIACAGEGDAVTISTNMAGRGTDIRLGAGVAELGGLNVIGTNKHESRRIDNQLRGRAGRQGDPGCSRFYISVEDDLMVKYAELDPRYRRDPDSMQRLVEGQHLNTRTFLHGYEVPIEGQRNKIQEQRQEVLESSMPERERRITLRAIDDLWADYIAQVADYRSGVQWISWSGKDPHRAYVLKVHEWFAEFEAALPGEIARRLEDPGEEFSSRGAVWTYLTTDQPFPNLLHRLARGIRDAIAVYMFPG